MNEFELTQAPRGDGGVCIAASGEVDIATAPRLEAALRAAVDGEASSGAIALDLSAVTFMDSTGLRAVLVGHRDAAAAGREFLVATGASPVRRLFELARLGDELTLVDDPAGLR